MEDNCINITVVGHKGKRLGMDGWNIYSASNLALQDILLTSFKKVAEINKLHPINIYLGGDLGTDQIAFFAAKRFRELNPTLVKIILCIPYIGFDSKWSVANKNELSKEIHECDKLIVVDTDIVEEKYMSNNLFIKCNKRSEFMIDKSNLLLAVFDNIKTGDTYNCIQYAKKQYKQIKYIDTNYMMPYESKIKDSFDVNDKTKI